MLVKKANQVCGSFLLNYLSRSGPPVAGPKDPWPRVLLLPERFDGGPASLARDNIYEKPTKGYVNMHEQGAKRLVYALAGGSTCMSVCKPVILPNEGDRSQNYIQGYW